MDELVLVVAEAAVVVGGLAVVVGGLAVVVGGLAVVVGGLAPVGDRVVADGLAPPHAVTVLAKRSTTDVAMALLIPGAEDIDGPVS